MSGFFREYDIRGTGLDIGFARRLGKAFAKYIKRYRPDASAISVGRDVRLNSRELADGLCEGVSSCGLDVYDLGLCPTPLQYFSLHTLEIDGGIMVTGSHNPPEFNGFKLSLSKETLHGDQIRELEEIFLTENDMSERSLGRIQSYDIMTPYSEYMFERFFYLAQRSKLKVVVDAGNGVGGLVAPGLISAVGCVVMELNCEPDGRFPKHHPDPTVIDNLHELKAAVRESGADIGIGYDGDADRIGVIDSEGGIVWADMLLAIFARSILKENPGMPVIADVKSSQTLFDEITRLGGRPIMYKTGHSLIKDKMRQTGSVLAGEFSGHIFLGDRYFGYDDAIYATLRLIEIMKLEGKGVKGLLEGMPELSATPEIRIDCPDDKKRDIVKDISVRLNEHREGLGIKDIITIDGLRITFKNGWGLIRASNTQPALIARIEAVDELSLDRYKGIILQTVDEILGTI